MKRLSKKAREEQQKAALLQRVMDICSGACKSAVDEDEALFPDHIAAIMGAVNGLWVNDANKHLVSFWNVDEYTSPSNICDFLYRNGVRA